ncbi:aldo/keto reductase [Aeromicrobium sp. CTD01-1L150]|uniref:aldo/keto reductase n=1 Tax=Aeromicrobium sp. CTD01-1L150 TaxID=3341830 RepID=UPI0035BF8505
MSEERYWADRVPETHRPYIADEDRYQHLEYRRVGTSGLLLPPISLGLWYNFGDNRPFDTQREVLRHAFDHGITHFDLANNYGPPYGSAEENFGRMMRTDFRPYRDEILVSSKAGWDMWPGPYGKLGSRKYVLSSLDASLERMSLEYVDIFYSHRVDPGTPVEETVGALDTAVRQGKALYAGISSYSPEKTAQAVAVARSLGTPLVIHQPSYSMLNRWVEGGGGAGPGGTSQHGAQRSAWGRAAGGNGGGAGPGGRAAGERTSLLAVLDEHGLGSIGFTPLAQGLLTDRYLGADAVERATQRPSLDESVLTDANLERLRGLAAIAAERGQSLAQMAISWVLRPGGVTSALIGASSTEQLDENLAAARQSEFSDEELARIDELAGTTDGVNIWSVSSDL